MSEASFKKAVFGANFKINVIRKVDDVTQFALIPSKQMYDFRMMCNPEITLRKFLSEREAQMKRWRSCFGEIWCNERNDGQACSV